MQKKPDDISGDNLDLGPLIEEALAWLVKLHSGEAVDADWNDYHLWCDVDDEHQSASLAAEQLWESLGTPLVKRKPPTALKVVALLGCFGAGAAMLAGSLSDMGHQLLADVRTAPLERKTMMLSDGSQIELDGGTSLDIKFDQGHRRVVLNSGDIYVKVARDPLRPFDVDAGATAVRALGTAFDVRRDGNDVDIIVTEHKVRVTTSAEAEAVAEGVEVSEGYEITYDAGAGLGKIRHADVTSATAWQRGRLVFQNRPLADVVAQVNRYRRGKIVIFDAKIARLPVTGTFDLTDGDALLDAVAATLPVHLRKLPWLTIVEADPDKKKDSN